VLLLRPTRVLQQEGAGDALASWEANFASNCGQHLPPYEQPEPATRAQFRLGAVLQHSNTPSLRAAGFEDEDDDDDEDEAPGEMVKEVRGEGMLAGIEC
jgi:hypothetical protein